tara:strand:- start:16 stop:840 length:825 start_codon:yes stop_codon:yes gene_type:complete
MNGGGARCAYTALGGAYYGDGERPSLCVEFSNPTVEEQEDANAADVADFSNQVSGVGDDAAVQQSIPQQPPQGSLQHGPHMPPGTNAKFNQLSPDNRRPVTPDGKWFVSINNYSLTNKLTHIFHGDPILIEITIHDTPDTVRNIVQKRWGITDGEMDNLRLSQINPYNTITYLEEFRGDLSKKKGEKGEEKLPYPYHDDNHRWIFIDPEDCLVSYLIRTACGNCVRYETCPTSDRHQSFNNVLNLSFEHLKRRGKTKSSSGYSRWATRELTIKK